uniref:Apoptosis 2 inhibitor n=1 Tax=Lygus hesperus TaxID=30085 RepID=A0A0A9Y257_LYGHE
MNSEESRLRTFSGWPENAPVDSKRIAKAGFYFMGQGLEVQCFSCGSRICEWNYGDKVMARHKSLDPRCPFVLNPRQSGNVPLKSNQSSAGGSTSAVVQPERTTTEDVADASALRRFVVPNAYHDEAVRLASFEDWPQPSVVSPAKLAMAGFYYTNERCKVMCAYCDGIIVHWNPGDDPELIHQKCYPECQFINDRLKYRIHPYSNIIIRDKTKIAESSEVEALKSLGVYYHRIPRNPKYSTIESRLRTYSKWSPSFNQLPGALADAGFYYTGVGDKVRCFHCDGGLKEWKKFDIPWVEHARWFSDCTFLSMVKGPDFVKEAISTIPNALKMELEQMRPQSQTQECHPVSEDYLMSLMSSSAAISALEMGIEASRVKCALKQKVKATGTPYSEGEADLLIIACMDIQSEEGSSTFDERSSASPVFCRRVVRTREHIPEASEDSDEGEGAPAIVSPPDPVQKEIDNSNVQLQSPVTKKELLDTQDTQVTLEEENRLLKEARLCKVCLDREVVIVFLPCAHLVTCSDCAQSLKDCPLCRQPIKATVRTFLS